MQQEGYDENNVYAKNVKDEVIHVSIVESGRKGYFCLGCGKEMQAVKSKLANRISYFRHDAKAVKGNKKCTYSDESYRHKIAKEMLLLEKVIKVPVLYKYPPKGISGLAIKLKDARLIEAASVQKEVSFYEDESGTVCWEKKIDSTNKFLLVRPDITFFDKDGNPILFIEIVVTHKVSIEKRVKLKRLGIDAIQVRIPKDSPEAIKEAFYTTEFTKWIYNSYEESNNYVSIPIADPKGISSIDQEQRDLFEESFLCRQSQIKNLIRSIGRCLESKQYREIESGFRDEIFRVEENSRRNRARLDQLRADHRSTVFERIKNELGDYERERESFESEESEFQRNSGELELRYKSRKSQLEREAKEIERELRGEDEIENGNGIGVTERRRRNKVTKGDLRKDTQQETEEIARIEREEGELPKRNEDIKKSIIKEFEQNTEHEEREVKRIQQEEGELPGKYEYEERTIGEDFEGKTRLLEEEFEETRKRVDYAIRGRNGVGNTELHVRIRGLLEARKQLENLEQIRANGRRNRKAWTAFNSGAFKNWNE